METTVIKANIFKLTPVAVSLLFLANPAYSEEDVEVVKVVGNTTEVTDAYIDASELDKSMAQDLNDVFRKQAEVSVGGTTAVSQKVYIRGIEDTMINISIDGAEQSSSLYHHQGSLSIEPELLKQVEVSAGAGRATDGFGAIGGAIKFKTKDAHDLLKQGDKFGAITKAGYYSNTNGYKVSASFFGEVTEGLGLLGSISGLANDNYVDGNGDEQAYTESDQLSGLLKLSGQLNDNNYVSLSLDMRNDSGERLHRPQWAETPRNPAFDQSFTRQTISLNHAYTGNDFLNLDSTLYYTSAGLLHDEHPRFGKSDGSIDTYGLKFQNQSDFSSNQLVYGIEFKSDNSSFHNAADGGETTEEGSMAAVFVQDDWRITQQLVLTAGARYDWYQLKDNLEQDFDSSGFSPNVGLNYSLIDGLDLFVSHAQAFRGPQVKELYVIYKKNDADLKGEKAQNNEVGFSYQHANFIAGANYFNSTIKDTIAYSYDSRNITNVGELTTTGFNVFAGYNTDLLAASLNYNQSNPELNGEALTDDSTSLGTSMGDKWILDLTYFASETLDMGWTATFVERYDDVDTSINPEKPGYGVHDIYAQWLPVEDLTVTLSVKNLFDKYYKDHASYSEYIGSPLAIGGANPGRDFRINVAYNF
ncbi:TonB-dependent receptor [Psychromonas sp. psych-6C06]|nr:TonB-dependent receptor [Psychromonas sp. psych-6C06]